MKFVNEMTAMVLSSIHMDKVDLVFEMSRRYVIVFVIFGVEIILIGMAVLD